MTLSPLPGHRQLFSCCVFIWLKVWGSSGVFTRAQPHSWKLHLHDLIASQRLHLQILLHWELGFNIWILGEYTHLGLPYSSDGKKNLSLMQEIWVRSLGQEDPLEKEMATHSSILAWRIPWTRSLAGYSLWGCRESDTTEQLTHTHADTFSP